MSGYEDDLARWLREAETRERAAQDRHRELLEAQKRASEQLVKAVEEGFKLLHDVLLTSR
jgi:hypothetical protein